MRHFLFALGFAMLAVSPAFAEALPPEALQQQYQACLDKIANNGDGIALTAKQHYCACVRDGLAAKWDTDKVMAMAAADQQQGKLPESDLAAVEEIGRNCVAQALR